MLKGFINLSLFKKVIVISLLLFLVGTCWGIFNSHYSYKLMHEGIDKKNRALVEAMVSSINNITDNSVVSREQTLEIAKNFVRHARYDQKQYFWINDMNGRVLVHPILPQLESQDLAKDNPKLHKLFNNFASEAKKNAEGTYYYYEWSKPGEDPNKLYPKSSFVKQVPSLGWVVGTGVYTDDVRAKTMEVVYQLMIFLALFAAALVVGVYFVKTMLTQPLLLLAKNLESLANGDITVEVSHSDRKDEVGMMAKAFEVFKRNAIEKKRLEEESIAAAERAEAEKIAMMNKMAENFEQQVSGVIARLTHSSASLTEMSGALERVSKDNLESSEIVAQAAAEADANVQTVAAATEELSASSSEISRQIGGVAEKSAQASKEAEATSNDVNDLKELAESIGDVVLAIKDIAEQTNLLAIKCHYRGGTRRKCG